MINKLVTNISYKMECRRSCSRKKIENRDSHNAYTYSVTGNIFNRVIGSVCVVYGAVTILLPTGSIPMILLGLFLISCPISIKVLLKGLYRDVRYWVGVRW